MSTVRVVVADDQRVVRDGLASILAIFDGIDVVGVAADGAQALALVAEHDPDVLLTDLRMPGMGGIEAITQLVAAGRRTKAVALTTYDDDATIVEALDAGAVGFLNKDADPQTLRTAIEAAAAGRSLLDAKAMSALLARDRLAAARGHGTPDHNPDGLTEREVEVLALIAAGSSNQQIASTLVVSMATVKTHVNHLLSKTGSRDRAALVAYAYRHGLARRP
ncbi:response regulator transcription factor [Gordonia jinhuaensis]|uniref:DNA-binding response regulator n=1 Tax=Gordonia jinhuaensis TaxID=1517702 RepID=A0A916X0K0_9ACTN|nr:response regulator transcription factor [Gordonia jinhuaensis]GGB47517.1 DNA-binding response regulator [Gordonia jinhuaensis]